MSNWNVPLLLTVLFHLISFFSGFTIPCSFCILLFIHHQLLAAAIGDKNYSWTGELGYKGTGQSLYLL